MVVDFSDLPWADFRFMKLIWNWKTMASPAITWSVFLIVYLSVKTPRNSWMGAKWDGACSVSLLVVRLQKKGGKKKVPHSERKVSWFIGKLLIMSNFQTGRRPTVRRLTLPENDAQSVMSACTTLPSRAVVIAPIMQRSKVCSTTRGKCPFVQCDVWTHHETR